MKERPILFSGPMVRALLAGRKTQTRRIVKGVEECPHGYDGVVTCTVPQEAHLVGKHCFALASGESLYLRCPYGVPGDRLWVRETWKPHPPHTGRTRTTAAIYRADYTLSAGPGPWRPAIHIPRWASRIVLEVTAVRVERLFNITEADCRAEGMLRVGKRWSSDEGQPTSDDARRAFEDLWHSINGAWLDCWVWVVEFKRGTQ